jgi:hypothetical protein
MIAAGMNPPATLFAVAGFAVVDTDREEVPGQEFSKFLPEVQRRVRFWTGILQAFFTLPLH